MSFVTWRPESLRALRLTDLASYLRSRGWKQTQRLGDAGTVWELSCGDDEYEVLLPAHQRVADYVQRIADILETVAVVEARSVSEVVRDLEVASADVVRVRLTDDGLRDGSIPLDDGVQLVEKARDLVVAAACAAVRPRAVYHARRPERVGEHLKRVRLGQTERGSYTIIIRWQVPPRLVVQGQVDLFQEPFERQVTLTLAHAVAASTAAAQTAAATADWTPFNDAVPKGVSANLCEALAGLGGERADRSVDFRFSWSPVREVQEGTPCDVSVPAETLPILEEAARVFRDQSPRDGFELTGTVVGLRRDEGSPIGTVTVAGVVDGNMRKIRVALVDPDYDKAIEAHQGQETTRFSCVGELVREGRSFVLQTPRRVQVEDEE